MNSVHKGAYLTYNTTWDENSLMALNLGFHKSNQLPAMKCDSLISVTRQGIKNMASA